jgi:hypothetical protein
MEKEIIKRREFTESRRKNGELGGRPKKQKKASEKASAKPSEKATQNLIENENINENIIDNDNGKKENKLLIEKIMKYFKFTEINHYNQMVEIGRFIFVLTNQKKIEHFENQFESYKQYKEKSKTTRHAFKNYLGNATENYMDGGWNAENWEEKLISLDNNNLIDKIDINKKSW